MSDSSATARIFASVGGVKYPEGVGGMGALAEEDAP